MFRFLRDLPIYYNADGGGGAGVPTPTPPIPTPKPTDTTIPKHRFDEVYGEMKTYKEQVEAFTKAEAERTLRDEEAEKKRLEETQQYQELYSKTNSELEKYKLEAEKASAQATTYEATVNKLVETELANVDEKLHILVPTEMSATQKLDWITNAKKVGLFGANPDITIGQPTKINPPLADPKKMTAFDKIMAGMSKIDASKR